MAYPYLEAEDSRNVLSLQPIGCPHSRIPLRKLWECQIKNPRKATVGGDLGNWETPWLKIYLIISLLVAIITFIVGMMIG